MIKLEHISKTFGGPDSGVHAVRDVSLEIEDGEIFGIIGFSGAGKSTLVRCINLLELPTSAPSLWTVQELTSLSERGAAGKPRKKISMILSELQPADAENVPQKCVLPHGAFRCAPSAGREKGAGAAGAGRAEGKGQCLSLTALWRTKAAG